MDKPVILSISFGFHDSGITLSAGRRIIAVMELERFFRVKKMSATPDQMEAAASFLLRRFGLTPRDVDLIAASPAPEKFWHAREAIPDLVETKITFLGETFPCLEIRHHYAHAGMFLISGLDEALIGTCDSGGHMEYAEFFRGKGTSVERLTSGDDSLVNTVGYYWFSRLLYGYDFAEGKMMGLSAHGKADDALLEKVRQDFRQLCRLKYDGAREYILERYSEYDGLARRDPMAAANLARAVQASFVNLRLDDIKRFIRPDERNMVVLGGSALNLECNTKIVSRLGLNIFVPPNADDTGISLGQAAIAIVRETGRRPTASLPFLGVRETPGCYRKARKRLGGRIFEEPAKIAKALADNKVCLAHIGSAETGPRALGHRSFLMNALRAENKKILSEDIKKRESYRPVAPLVLEEDAGKYFTGAPLVSPFMLFSHQVKPEARDMLAAVTHVDNTARIQTVSREQEPFLHEVLSEFKDLTGHGVLINTSLNMVGEPLADSLWQTYANYQKIGKSSFVAVDPEQEPV